MIHESSVIRHYKEFQRKSLLVNQISAFAQLWTPFQNAPLSDNSMSNTHIYKKGITGIQIIVIDL